MAEDNLNGIGGWLIVYLILIFLGIAGGILALVSALSSAVTEIILMALTILFPVIIVFLLFSKSREAPAGIITLTWMGFALGVVNTIFYSIPKAAATIAAANPSLAGMATISGYIGLAIGAIIDIIVTLYFMRSKRVKNTFVK